jgi:integrase
MAVYRRGDDDEWWYHFFYKGQHVQERTGTSNKQQAKRMEAVHKAELLLTRSIAGPKQSPKFCEFAAPYLDYSKSNKLSYGVEVYYVNGTLVPFFGLLALDRITPFEVERFKQKRLKDGLKKSSINREIGLLKSMLRTAMEWELTSRNGAKEAKLFKLDDPLSDRVLSYEEERKLLAACDEPELRCRAPHLKSIVLVALYTGLRRGEILRLRWADIDFQQNVLTVQKAKTKSGRGRRVNLNSMLGETLRLLREAQESEWVFPSPKRFQTLGKPEKHIGDVKNAFRRAVRLSGIEPITFHQLRHTFCSRLADAGVPLPVIQDLAGHASITMTRRYTHPADEMKQKAVEILVRTATEAGAYPLQNPLRKVLSIRKAEIGETANTGRSVG